MASAVQHERASVPAVSSGTLLRILAAGGAGLVVWEIFARLAAPLWLGHPLEPTALIEMALGVSGMPAQLLHLLTGLVLFPAGYLLLLRPLAGRFAAGLAWPLLGVGAVAWASLIGHVLLGLALAATAAQMARSAR